MPNKYIRINNAVCTDLEWAASHLERDTGIRILHQINWDTSSANVTLYCDVCLEGMGFWSPDKCVGYYSPVPETTTEEHIFYYEALCVLSAIHYVTDFLCVPPTSKILIYTDNDNTVAIFNKLWCLPHYNPILIDAADICITTNIHLQVLHIPGELNKVADAISCNNFPLAQQYAPNIIISSFLPPQLPLGAIKKWLPPQYVPGSHLGNPGHVNDFSESEQLRLDKPSITQPGKTTARPSTPTWISSNYMNSQ